MLSTIWFDESGFTGHDLINPDQRHFALASTVIGDEESEAILRECFPGYGGREFKFSTLWRRKSHRAGLLKFAEQLPDFGDQTYVYLMDKRFSLLIKFVDYLIEPLVWASGGDFYRDAYSRKFVNGLNADLRELGSPGLYDETIAMWNRLAREPTEARLNELKAFIAAKARELPPPLSSFYDLAGKGAEFFTEPGENVEDFKDSNDLQVTAMLSSVTHWRSIREEDFRIVHDESNSFFKDRAIWETLMRDDVEPFRAMAADGAPVIFPLRVKSTMGERSERSAAIQLCDVLAGLFTRAARIFTGARDPFILELMRAGLGDASFDGVMPERERVTGPPPSREGPDLIDSMVGVLKPFIDQTVGKRRRGGA